MQVVRIALLLPEIVHGQPGMDPAKGAASDSEVM